MNAYWNAQDESRTPVAAGKTNIELPWPHFVSRDLTCFCDSQRSNVHPTHDWTCNCLCMLGLKFLHVNKMNPMGTFNDRNKFKLCMVK